MSTHWLVRVAVVALGAALTHVFFVQFCDILFGCGCRALWAGADVACNVHNSQPPHCPWCLDGGVYGTGSFGAIIVVQIGLGASPGIGLAARAIAILAAFPVIGALAGLLAGLLTGYWG